MKTIRLALLSLLVFLSIIPELAGASIPITGTIVLPNGNRFNGVLRMTLSVSVARDSTDSNLVVAQRVTWNVVNGSLPTTARIRPNDVLQPSGTWYTAEYFSTAGTRIAANTYIITGSSYNIGQAIPTPVTTSNISFTDVPTGTGTTDCLVMWTSSTTIGCATLYRHTTAGTASLGTTALPFASIFIGTAATNNVNIAPAATTAAVVATVDDPGIAAVKLPLGMRGNITFTAAAIGANACGTDATATVTGLTTASVLAVSLAAAPDSTTDNGLVWYYWPTSNTVNIRVCNPTAGSLTPAANLTFRYMAFLP